MAITMIYGSVSGYSCNNYETVGQEQSNNKSLSFGRGQNHSNDLVFGRGQNCSSYTIVGQGQILRYLVNGGHGCNNV